jgi:hypothetical protein
VNEFITITFSGYIVSLVDYGLILGIFVTIVIGIIGFYLTIKYGKKQSGSSVRKPSLTVDNKLKKHSLHLTVGRGSRKYDSLFSNII